VREPFVTPETLPSKAREWKARLEPYVRRHRQPDGDHAALIVVDMQRYFIDPGAGGFTAGGPAILNNLKLLLGCFRAAGLPVIYTRHAHSDLAYDGGMMAEWWGDHIMEGTPESEIHSEVAPAPEDRIITKHRYSAFFNTDLESSLRCRGVTDLVITGVMTNLCCESTARDAFFRNFRVFFPLDATGAVREEFHLSALINLAYGFAYITDTEELLGQLSRG